MDEIGIRRIDRDHAGYFTIDFFQSSKYSLSITRRQSFDSPDLASGFSKNRPYLSVRIFFDLRDSLSDFSRMAEKCSSFIITRTAQTPYSLVPQNAFGNCDKKRALT
jgi:hypothetical protein